MDYIEISCRIEPRFPGADILMAELADSGFESFTETAEGFSAFIPSESFTAESLDPLKQFDTSMGVLHYDQQLIKARNWNSEWEKSFQPVVVAGKCCIRAPFHEAIPGMEFDLVIEPQMSFGTGHHQTTSLITEKLLTLPLASRSVMDMGCGTGVLAILAAKRGAGPVEAVDVEDNAVENAAANCARNGFAGIIVNKGDDRLLAGKSFDVILANINKNVLLHALPAYAAALGPGGDLLLSGFFITDCDELSHKAADCGLIAAGMQSRDEWAMLHFQKTKTV